MVEQTIDRSINQPCRVTCSTNQLTSSDGKPSRALAVIKGKAEQTDTHEGGARTKANSNDPARLTLRNSLNSFNVLPIVLRARAQEY